MNTVEKTASVSTPSVVGKDNRNDEPAHNLGGRHPPGRSHDRKQLDQALADAKPTLHLDYIRLRHEGIIASQDEAPLLDVQYRRIKRPLLANARNKSILPSARSNLIMITSALSGEGKTYTAINLALSVARGLDSTVLLVDADVFKRDTSQLLGLADRPGLLDLLHDDQLTVSASLIRTNVSRLVVLPAGQPRHEAAELVASHDMSRLADELSTRYPERIVIFDSPALLATAEAQVLAEVVGQILIVVEANRTPTSAVEEAVSTLERRKPIGLVLNKSRRLPGSDYYGSYHKYEP